ncbi:MAG: S24 family peptidase [Bacteroidota bacterium]
MFRLRSYHPLNTSDQRWIWYAPLPATASNARNLKVLEHRPFFHIPGLQNDLVAFSVQGNSMTPTIEDGDLVICSSGIHPTDLIDMDIYTIVTKDSVRVKRIQRIHNRNGELTHLKLISDNQQEHRPDLLRLHEVEQLFKVERRLTGLGRL